MRKTAIVFIAAAWMISCNNDTRTTTVDSKVKYSDIAIEMLKGDIASYEETPYKTDSAGKLREMDSCCIGAATVDSNGNYTSWIEKDSKGTVTLEDVYERYEDGLWKSLKEKKGGKPALAMTTRVNDKGEYAAAEDLDSAGKLTNYYTGLTQNEYGLVTSWKQYDKDSVFRESGESKYDKSLLNTFTNKDSMGKIKLERVYQYNDKGEQTEVATKTVTKDSTTTTIKKYSYESHDEMGNWTQRTEWNDKGKSVKIIKRSYVYRKPEEKK